MAETNDKAKNLDSVHLDLYTKAATNYDQERFHSVEGKIFAELEDALFKEMIGKEQLKNTLILDVATGTGRISISMAKAGARVIGLDQTPNMLKEAQKKAQENRIENISFTVGNARELPFANETFDLVSSIRFLTIISPEYLSFYVNEMKRVLKKGGVLLVEFNNKLDIRELIKIKNRRNNPWPWQIESVLKDVKIVQKRGCWFPGHRRIARCNKPLAIALSKLGHFFPFYYLTSQIIIKAVKEDDGQ